MENNKQYYTTVNGTSYDINTDKKIVSILDDAIINRKRLKLDYGNTETGENWNECYDIIGRIGRSTGTIKIPLLILTSRSYGGGAILDSSIIKITDKKTGIIGHRKTNYIVLKSFPKTSWTNHYVMFFTDLEKKALAIFNN